MNIFLFCSAILVLFYFALSFNVSRLRSGMRGTAAVTDVQLTKAVRAHGNSAEYIPLFVVAFLYFSSTDLVWLQAIAVAATASRIAHASGLLLAASANARHPLRFIGALGTYACGFAFGIAFLIQAQPHK